MDARKRLKHERLMTGLRAAFSNADAEGVAPDEAIGVALELCGQVYSLEVSGAVTRKEIRSARRLFTEATRRMLRALPTRAKDIAAENELFKRGLK